jgi:hypothetical protein
VITIMNPDGTGRTPVGIGSGGWCTPAWSPTFSDGTVKLAYPGYNSTSHTMYLNVVNVFEDVGTAPYLSLGTPTPVEGLTEYRALVTALDWSPIAEQEKSADGSWTGRDRVRVAYSFSSTVGPAATHVVDLIYDSITDTFTVAETMYDPVTGHFSPLVLDPSPGLYGLGAIYWVPRFSPDGTLLVLSRSDTLPDGTYQASIWVATADGLQAWPVSNIPAGAGMAAWSPNGRQLAFAWNYDLYVADLDSSMTFATSIKRVTKASNTSNREEFPTWSLDGKQIAYSRGGPVGKVDLATGAQYDLGRGDDPDWSPMVLPRLGP